MYAENVRDYIMELSGSLDHDMADAVGGCESPIEQLVSLGLMESIKRFYGHFGSRNAQVWYTKQESIEVKKRTYRVDFLLRGEWTTGDTTVTRELIVECDGHGYHSTKEQIKKDNRRNRDLMAAGYTVVHFSGSEINEDPKKCAVYAIKLLMRDFVESNHKEGKVENASEGN